MSDDKVLTVREVIALLQALDESMLDREVWLDGCDCMGACSGMRIDPYLADDGKGTAVVLERLP